MKAIDPYLTFNRNCREAMELYAKALDGHLTLMTWAEAPEPPPEGADRVMHSRLMLRDGVHGVRHTGWPTADPDRPQRGAFDRVQ